MFVWFLVLFCLICVKDITPNSRSGQIFVVVVVVVTNMFNTIKGDRD